MADDVLFFFPYELRKAQVQFLVKPASAPAAEEEPEAEPEEATGAETETATETEAESEPEPEPDEPAAPEGDDDAAEDAATDVPDADHTGETPPPPPAEGAETPPPNVADVFKNANKDAPAWNTYDLEVESSKGTLALEFLADAFMAGELGFEHSPFLIKGPPPPEVPPEPPKPKKKKLSAKGKLGINFGKDKLTLTFALNGGGGAAASGGGGAGYVASGAGGQGGAVTINAKGYTLQPVFEVGPLLKSDESVVVALRCLLRYFYHWCDAANLAVDYVKTKLPATRSAGDFMSEFLGFNWWMGVFSVFAMKDMLCDIMTDEADFIAEFLQKIGLEAKFDVNAAGNFDVEIGVDASYTISGRAYLPLAVVLAPLIQFMMAGSNAPRPSGGTLADKIIPYVEGTVEQRISIAAGGMPAAIMVEAKGALAKCTFAVPKGSPLRAKIEKMGEEVAKAADHYKNSKLKKIPDETKLLRLIIDLLDHEVRNIVKMVRAGRKAADGDASATGEGIDALNSAVATATPYVKQIMDALNGKTAEEPPGISPAAQQVIDMLKSTKVHGAPIGSLGPLEQQQNGERTRVVLHVDDEEKAKIQGAGFSPPSIEAVFESTTLEIPLPVRPTAVGWNHVSQNPRLANDYAGIIAGFDDTGGRDQCKQACRARGWVPDELGQYEDQHPNDSQGLNWAWVAVGISRALSQREPPLVMPELELTEEGKLRLTFDELPIGSVPDSIKSEVALFAEAAITRVKIWKAVLIDDATAEEAEAIAETVDENQPDDDPYANVLDDWLDEANGGGAANAADETDARFSRLG